MKEHPTVLAIGAHPDDVDFGCGATMALLASQGAKLHFAVCTDGNRGSRQHEVEKSELVSERHTEQMYAAQILGTQDVTFLDEEDGNLQADIKFKERIVRLIRTVKPDMVFTHDPTWFYYLDEEKHDAHVNHTDHRACGAAVLDAVYPLARDLQSFPEHHAEGLAPHKVPELYLFSFGKAPQFACDVTGFVDAQIDAICAHKSQIDDPDWVRTFMTERHAKHGRKFGYEYAETFTKLVFD